MKILLLFAFFIHWTFLFSQNFNKSGEFNNNNGQLGEYISIYNHPKAKGVNLKLKVPLGWEVAEGDRPNIVKKFVNHGNTYLVLIKDNVTFLSRKQIRESFQKENLANELIQEIISGLKQPKIINQSVVSIDNYPALQFTFTCNVERLGYIIPLRMMCWAILYEDKLIYLQSTSYNNQSFKELEHLYLSITNSVVFPEQYN